MSHELVRSEPDRRREHIAGAPMQIATPVHIATPMHMRATPRGNVPSMAFTELASSDLFRALVVFAAAFRAGAAFAVIDQPRLPPLSGVHKHVGISYTRCGGARMKLFYPARAPSDTSAKYCTDGRKTSDGMAGLVLFRQLGLSFLLAHLADADAGASIDAPPATDADLPLLVYSHGFGGNMDMATYLMRAFASHGIVVAAVAHADGTASFTTTGNDDVPKPFEPLALSRKEQLNRRADELLAAAEPGALSLPQGLSVGDTFIGGHSFGGPAALLASANAPARASACVACCCTILPSAWALTSGRSDAARVMCQRSLTSRMSTIGTGCVAATRPYIRLVASTGTLSMRRCGRPIG